MTTTEFKKGDKVKITGEHGTVYVVHRDEFNADGSLLLFGGSTNPNKSQKFRSVMPARIVRYKKG